MWKAVGGDGGEEQRFKWYIILLRGSPLVILLFIATSGKRSYLNPFTANVAKTKRAVWKLWKSSRLQNKTQIHLCFTYCIYWWQKQYYLLMSANFAELCKSCCFSRMTDSLFQNIFSSIRCYFLQLPFCLVAVGYLWQHFMSIVYYQCVSLYTDTIIRKIWCCVFTISAECDIIKQDVVFS